MLYSLDIQRNRYIDMHLNRRYGTSNCDIPGAICPVSFLTNIIFSVLFRINFNDSYNLKLITTYIPRECNYSLQYDNENLISIFHTKRFPMVTNIKKIVQDS